MKKKHIIKVVSLMLLMSMTASVLLTGCKGNGNDKKNEESTMDSSKYKENEYKTSVLQYNTLPDVSVHDPSIFKDPATGKYYVFGSHLAQASSDDMISWKYLGVQGYSNQSIYGKLEEGLAGSFEWAGYDDSDCKGGYAVWAPEIIYNEHYVWEDGSKGAYMLYYSASSTYCRSCIGYAVSKNVEEGYKYVDTVIYSGFTSVEAYDEKSTHNKHVENTNVYEVYGTTNVSDLRASYFSNNGSGYNTSQFPNAIDPSIFFDEEGKLWMTYGSWSGGIWIIELDPATGQAIHNYENNDDKNNFTDKYFGKRIAYGNGVSGEGPYIRYNSETGYYYLFATIGWLGVDGGYNMRMFRSENPDGPYMDAKDRQATNMAGKDNASVGVKVMGGYSFPSLNTGYLSPGHNSFIFDGDKSLLIYHTRFENRGEAHQMRVHQMLMNKEGWLCTLPFQYKGETASESGYTGEEIAGVYHFLDHTADTITTAVKPVEYYLDANGNVSKMKKPEVALGIWSVEEGTNYITMKIGTKEYSGVVCRMEDEAGNSVMTISAITEKNNSLWAVKYE